MCLRWNEGQSPIYNNEPLAAWSRGACAVRRGLLQPQTGRPVTKHCTAAAAAYGLTTTTTAPGHWHTRSTRPAWQNTTRTHPGGEEKTPQWVTDVWLRGGGVFAVLYCAFPPHGNILARAPLLSLSLRSSLGLFPTVGAELFREACRGGR